MSLSVYHYRIGRLGPAVEVAVVVAAEVHLAAALAQAVALRLAEEAEAAAAQRHFQLRQSIREREENCPRARALGN